MSVRKGHNLLTQLVSSGEVPVGLSMYNYLVEQAKKKGAPIDSFLLAPTVASFKGIALMKRAPHPHAAMLFYDFMLSDGQSIMVNRSLISTSNKFESPLKNLPLKFIDPVATVDQDDKWVKDYEAAVTKRARPR
jgi:iron(III) transport system substrate-binding protein